MRVAHQNRVPKEFLKFIGELKPDSRTTAVMYTIAEISAMDEDEHQLRTWLAEEELEKLSSLRFAKRRNEWLAGRICAKQAITLHTKVDVQPNDFAIRNKEGGRPYVSNLGPTTLQKAMDISISHSKGYAIALLSSHYCGIDIQEPKASLFKVKERFCTADEEALLTSQPTFSDGPVLTEMQRLNLLWAGKEAVRKAKSHDYLPEFLRMEMMDLCYQGGSCYQMHFRLRGEDINIIAIHDQQYAMACCLLGVCSHA